MGRGREVHSLHRQVFQSLDAILFGQISLELSFQNLQASETHHTILFTGRQLPPTCTVLAQTDAIFPLSFDSYSIYFMIFL